MAATQEIVVAAGCFWCVEHAYHGVEGVTDTKCGYMGGEIDNPTYEQVSAGGSGHREVVKIWFDAAVISLETILEIYWQNVDPFDGDGQFCDRGFQYSPAIYVDDTQRDMVLASKGAVDKIKETAVTIEPLSTFYAAENYHQLYFEENPFRYKFYRYSCGRDARLNDVRAIYQEYG
ncbi:MAG: peptide-methionine (S)-S-oxide reductase MsrA, partial [Alphaproteobacteria bacterium]